MTFLKKVAHFHDQTRNPSKNESGKKQTPTKNFEQQPQNETHQNSERSKNTKTNVENYEILDGGHIWIITIRC